MKLEDANFLEKDEKDAIRLLAQNVTSQDIKQWRKFLDTYEVIQIKSVLYTILIAISFVVAYFYRFDPAYEYNGYNGEWHMFIVVPKWILSFFFEDITCRPPLYTTAYVVGQWISLVMLVFIMYAFYFYYVFMALYKLPEVKKIRICLNLLETYELLPPEEEDAVENDQPEQTD